MTEIYDFSSLYDEITAALRKSQFALDMHAKPKGFYLSKGFIWWRAKLENPVNINGQGLYTHVHLMPFRITRESLLIDGRMDYAELISNYKKGLFPNIDPNSGDFHFDGWQKEFEDAPGIYQLILVRKNNNNRYGPGMEIHQDPDSLNRIFYPDLNGCYDKRLFCESIEKLGKIEKRFIHFPL